MDLTRSVITREHVLRLLPIMGLTEEQEDRVLALRYPVPSGEAAAVFESVGVELETLTDRMGGSP
jgi:hypothetical protein